MFGNRGEGLVTSITFNSVLKTCIVALTPSRIACTLCMRSASEVVESEAALGGRKQQE